MPWLRHDWPWVVALVCATFVGSSLERAMRRRRWRPLHHYNGFPAPRAVAPRMLPQFDTATQLRCVEQAVFNPRRLLNRGEERLWRTIEQACREEMPEWRVMAQVSLGEILASPSEQAYRAINSKRVDLLIVGADGFPIQAVELQGSGHYLGTAATRDAIKKEALRRAGIGYVEVVAGDTPAEVRAMIAKLARRTRDPVASVAAHHTTG